MAELSVREAKKAQLEKPYGFYRPAHGDKLDVGFWVKGYAFHWMYAKKQEYSQDRPWLPLVKGKLPNAFEKAILEKRPSFFGTDGMVHNAELILGYCREEDLNTWKDERKQDNLDQLRSINAVPDSARSITVKAEFENPMDLGADAFKNL